MAGPNVSDYYDVDYSGLEYGAVAGPAAAEQPTTALASPASMASSLAAAGDGGGGSGGGLGSSMGMGGVSVHGHQISEVAMLDFGTSLANASSNATGDLMMDPTTAAMATHVVKSVTLVSIILLAIFSNLLVIIRDRTEQKMYLVSLPFLCGFPHSDFHSSNYQEPDLGVEYWHY